MALLLFVAGNFLQYYLEVECSNGETLMPVYMPMPSSHLAIDKIGHGDLHMSRVVSDTSIIYG